MEQTEYALSNDVTYLDRALELHNEVFDETEQTVYNSKAEWVKRIADGGYFVVSKDESVVAGYAVCDRLEDGNFKVWLAGVHPGYRGQGVWTSLFEDIKQHARGAGYEFIFLNTFPENYPHMFSFLQSVNAEMYKKEIVGGREKVFMKIAL